MDGETEALSSRTIPARGIYLILQGFTLGLVTLHPFKTSSEQDLPPNRSSFLNFRP